MRKSSSEMAAQGLTVSDWLRRKTLPGTGWVSHRGKGKSGNLLLERLPKDEWSSQRFHETTVAHRVAPSANSASARSCRPAMAQFLQPPRSSYRVSMTLCVCHILDLVN